MAVQYVDSKLAKLGYHPGNHYQRNTLVATQLSTLSVEYQFLKNKSEFARYFPDSEKRISPPMVQRCLSLAFTKLK